MKREEVTQKIIAAKMAKGLKWADIADRVGRSKEWTTAAMLGQMPMSKEEAAAIRPLQAFRHLCGNDLLRYLLVFHALPYKKY